MSTWDKLSEYLWCNRQTIRISVVSGDKIHVNFLDVHGEIKHSISAHGDAKDIEGLVEQALRLVELRTDMVDD